MLFVCETVSQCCTCVRQSVSAVRVQVRQSALYYCHPHLSNGRVCKRHGMGQGGQIRHSHDVEFRCPGNEPFHSCSEMPHGSTGIELKDTQFQCTYGVDNI